MTVIEELNHPVTGDWRGITVPVSSGNTNVPQIQVITGLVDFIPRVPRGFQFYVSDYDLYGDGSEVRDTAISLDPVFTARIWEGRLSTINKNDTADFKLPANIPALRASLQAQGLGADLVWDTRFRSVVFAEDDQALLPFAWVAPNDAATTICLTDPDLERLGYQGNATNLVTAYVDRMPDKVYVNDDGLLVFQAKGVDIPSGVAIAGLDIASVQGRALLQSVTPQDARILINATSPDDVAAAISGASSSTGKQVMNVTDGAGVRNIAGAAVVSTIAALKSVASVSAALGATDGHARVLGYTTAGDGGGGLFRWDSTDTTTADNGGTVIAPSTSLAGRWKRIYEGEVNARWFGMHPNSADNTAALQKAVDWVTAQGGGTVFIPTGYYRFLFDQGTSGLSTITISNNFVNIRGEGSGTTLTVRSHARPNQLDYFFTFSAGFKALGGGVKDLHIDGNSMLKWGIYVDTWHGAEFGNLYFTDVHEGLFDGYSTISPNCGESIYIHHVEYQCSSGTNSCFIRYGVRLRASAGASWSDCWISDCNFIGIWDTGVVLDGVIRVAVHNIGVSCNYASTNTTDGSSQGGVKHTVNITTTVNGTWSGSNGQHVVDGLYHESHAGNEDTTNYAAVLIESPSGGGAYNRYNRISNVDVSWNSTVAPATLRITNDNAVDSRVMDNTFIGNRRPITTEGQIYIGSLVRNTQLHLTPNLGGLGAIGLLDLGIRTRINGQALGTYRNNALWPDNKRGQAEFDVGEITRDALTGRVVLQDKNNDSVLIGARPGKDVVAPYGAQRIQAMSPPDAPSVTTTGTGVTAWNYYVVAIDKDGNKTIPSAVGTVTGPATLTSSNYNLVQWFPTPGAVTYDLLRGDTGHVVASGLVVTHFFDTGAATTTYTPATANPPGTLTVDGLLTARRATRITVTANPGSYTPDLSVYDQYVASGITSTLTINAAVNAQDGEDLWFRIRDAGTAKTIVWSGSYRIITSTALPTVTTAGKVTYVHCKYNAASSVMDVLDVRTQP